MKTVDADLVQAKLGCPHCHDPMMYHPRTGKYVCTNPSPHPAREVTPIIPIEEEVVDEAR